MNFFEPFHLIRATIEGRHGVLDDEGNVVESLRTHDFEHPEFHDHDEEFEDIEPDTGLPIDPKPRSRFRSSVQSALILLLAISIIGYLLYGIWRFSKFAGNLLYQTQGPLSGVFGLITLIAFLFIIVMATTRFDDARAHRRAIRGRRNFADRHSIYVSLIHYQVCGACDYPLPELKDPQQDQPQRVVCSECGACWKPSYWFNFFPNKRTGIYPQLSKSQRRKTCAYDLREQVFQILQDESDESRKARLEQTPHSLIPTHLMFVFVSLTLFGCFLGTTILGIVFSSDTIGLTICTLACVGFLTLVYPVFKAYRSSLKLSQLRKLMRNMFDEQRCPCCESDLETEPHPVDGAFMCNTCGLAFDPNTQSRKHHSRDTVSPNSINDDPVFYSSTEPHS